MKAPARKNKRKSKTLLTCGTQAAFEAHLRRNEHPCSRCLPFSDTYDDDEIIALRQELLDRVRNQALWDNYNITLTTFSRIFAEQGNRCACCKSSNSKGASWNIDHDHTTGQIRGILCFSCDSGIGFLGDDLFGIRRAEEYLLAHEKRGGHQRDFTPPPRHKTKPKISKRMQRCFNYFARGIPPDKIVILLRMKPSTVTNLEALWRSRGQPPAKTDHVFQVHRNPLCFGCSCGFESPVQGGLIQEAIARVNEHIEAAKAAEATRIDPIS